MLLNSHEKRDTRVLVVDDSATNRAVLRAILKGGGYEVEEAEDGKECLEKCEKAAPTVILLDVMMPNVDGLTACRKLREGHTKAELPIIMVTTLAETEGLAESLAAGANDYITKPIDRATLLARMENQIAWAQAQQHLAEQSRALEKALRVQSATGDVLPEAIVVHDAQGRVVYTNRTCVRFCAGRTFTTMPELCAGIFEGKYRDALIDCYHGARACPEEEFTRELVHSDPPFHTVFVLTKPVSVDDGSLRLWVWRDDTDRRDLERAVNQHIKLETVGMFAAGVAHNFNNIMGAVLGATEVLERITKDNERGQRCTQLIKKAIDGGKRLTRKMSAAYRQKQPIVVGEDSDLISVLDNLFECYEQADGNRITFVRESSGEIQNVIVPGPTLVEILGNILSNAIESIAETGTIHVSLTRPPTSENVQIAIKDTGRGMNEEELSRVFEPFFSTKNFDKLSGVAVEGRGLGMWNTYNLITSFGGTLTVDSKPGVGTTVTIQLPVVS